MTTPTHILRGGPPMLLALALASPVALAQADRKTGPTLPMTSTGQRYAIAGSLTPLAPSPAQGGGYQLSSSVTSTAAAPPVQAGGDIALIARLAISPMVCYGDTIFRDGFGP